MNNYGTKLAKFNKGVPYLNIGPIHNDIVIRWPRYDTTHKYSYLSIHYIVQGHTENCMSLARNLSIDKPVKPDRITRVFFIICIIGYRWDIKFDRGAQE